MSATITRSATATLAAAFLVGGLAATVPSPATASPTARPANDMFLRAQNVSAQGCDVSAEGDTVRATGQAREPIHLNASSRPTNSVWLKWRSPVDDTVVIDTSGSDFDTILAVYTGQALAPGMRVVAANDDEDGGSLTSEVSFEARRNVTYRIAVDGYRAATGEYVLNVTC
ncbi:MAG: hypothetical protein WB441_05935 [Nocardioidaceae bacterium]